MLQKVEKSLLKLLPKWAKIHQNIAPEATFGHWFCDFGPFGAMPKQHVFFVPILRLKKENSWPKMRPTGRQPRERDPTLASLVPQGAHAREASEKF